MTAQRQNIQLAIQPWFRDHALAGQPVLPAVESLALLAEAARKFSSTTDSCQMRNGCFSRFLELPDRETIGVVIELERVEDGVEAALYSRKRVGSFYRFLEHARVCFGDQGHSAAAETRSSSSLEGSSFRVSGEQIYRELISFGCSYQNLIKTELFPEGAVTHIKTPDIPLPINPALPGSPFLLDAAFHGACIWGQRFAGFVPFPVAFKKRQIFLASRPAQQYRSRITIIERSENQLIFDLDIVEPGGARVEQVQGLQMRDISNGRMKPPPWLQA